MTDLGTLTIPKKKTLDVGNGVSFSTNGHYFTAPSELDLDTCIDGLTAPLSVIAQVTKRCDMDCDYCSETLQRPDPTLDQLDTMRKNLKGVKRAFLSGGEPLLRKDFSEIVDMWHKDFILAVPTNATHGHQHARNIAGKIAYANIGLEGPRGVTNRVRGDYDTIMKGVQALQEAGIPLALSTVVLRSYSEYLPYTVQIADMLGAGKVKLIMPLRKGNALDLAEHEFMSHEEADSVYRRIMELRTTLMWRPAVRLTKWTPENEGHMICVEPNGMANAWPVYVAKDLFEPLGNVMEEPITELWKRYRFKRNHVTKYLGRSILAADYTEPADA
ncbi:radical SAM protein [Streptomyces sp. NPDC059743]|uniref:radical SAM protein n=1 Tax=Streptomyces sp. NPDC059743 TaxID=3346928 RepID=UPI00364606DC